MMKKNFILPLLAAASLTGVAQGALSDDQGNWSIVLDLKPDKIQALINKTDADLNTKAQGECHNGEAYDGYIGVNLVSWSGSADYTYIGTAVSGSTDNRTSSYWIGWGNDYFKENMTQDTGMSPGLQMGFAGGEGSANDAGVDKNPNLNSEFNTISYTNAGNYRAHTKQDLDGDFWQEDSEGASTMDNLQGIEITSATLALVHSNKNGEGTNQYNYHKWHKQAHSQTMQYLTITGLDADGNQITITYIAEVDDSGATAPWEGLTSGLYPSSNRYDVDILTSVQINCDYVNGYYIKDGVLSPDEVKNFDQSLFIGVPEPTSATLSMVALSALCARRRRRK